MKLKQGKYYVVNVKHKENNPVHRTIVRCADEEHGIVEFLTYVERLRVSIKQLNKFEVVSEITDMNQVPRSVKYG